MHAESPTFKPGIYQHYRGDLYQVIGIARDEATHDEVVVYYHLSGDFGMWTRKRAVFEETIEVNGKQVPRFKFVQSLFELPPKLR